MKIAVLVDGGYYRKEVKMYSEKLQQKKEQMSYINTVIDI